MCGGCLIGLVVLDNSKSRMADGLGLVYYLFGAVALDIKVHPLYEAVQKVSLERLRSAGHLEEVAKQDAQNKRRLYWGTLRKFLYIHVWGAAFVVSFFWAYVDGDQATILLLSYMFAYTGLLWFQCSKVFCRPIALRPFIVAFVLDFGFGLPLRLLRPTIYWDNVLALGVSSWSAGILAFLETRLYAPPKQFKDEEKSQSQKVIGPHNDMPQEQLNSLFDEVDRLPKNMRLLIKSPGSIGNEVLQILTAGRHASKAPEHFVMRLLYSIRLSSVGIPGRQSWKLFRLDS
jgi:hypothetical protein